MNDKDITTEGLPLIYMKKDALFMRPNATSVQITEAIRRAHAELIRRIESGSIDDSVPMETLRIILEFHLDDVLGHGEEPAFVG
mgnify:FL=1|jgi:hypothetical protein|tara:strand:- start:238 stop:489 length:252 start_codon:yes stop_codon:yes gene_type:complete